MPESVYTLVDCDQRKAVLDCGRNDVPIARIAVAPFNLSGKKCDSDGHGKNDKSLRGALQPFGVRIPYRDGSFDKVARKLGKGDVTDGEVSGPSVRKDASNLFGESRILLPGPIDHVSIEQVFHRLTSG